MNFRTKLLFRFLAMTDVLFAPKFELTTYRKDGSRKCSTGFDKKDFKRRSKQTNLPQLK